MDMKYLPTTLATLIAVLLVSSVAYAATFYPSGGGTYRLQSSVGTSNSTIPLSSFKEPISNTKYTMSYLNSSTECGTLDPQTTRSEFISFTGITQNSDGTATLTGVSRGLGRSYPYAASTTLAQSHAGQSIFILSDAPCLFQNYPAKVNDETVSGSWSFPAPIIGANAATRDYVDGKVFTGIGNASETATGTVEIATGAEAAASTMNGTLGRLALPATLATTTFNSATAANRLPVTSGAGKLDPYFIATSTLGLPTFADIQTFTSTTSPGTWTKPSDAKLVDITLIGGGQSGGVVGSCGTATANIGGVNGAYVHTVVSAALLPSTMTVTIGAGGIGPSSTGGSQASGGTTSFGTYIAAPGGTTSVVSTIPSQSGGAGGKTGGPTNAITGTASPFNSLLLGGAFGAGGTSSGSVGSIGSSASSTYPIIGGTGGGGGYCISNSCGSAAGGKGGLYGAGGGGAGDCGTSGSTGKGGDGADGIASIVTYK